MIISKKRLKRLLDEEYGIGFIQGANYVMNSIDESRKSKCKKKNQK